MTYRNMIEGLNIFAKYTKCGLDEDLGGSDHDVIFIASCGLDVSEEDRARLEELGFEESSEFDCWTCYA